MFNDAVLNKIEYYAYEIVRTIIPSFGRDSNSSRSEYVERWNYESECLGTFNHLLGLVDKNELQDNDLYNLQSLCLEVLKVSVQKGFIEGTEELLQRIGLGLLEKDCVRIENKQGIVEESLERLVKTSAIGYSEYLTNNNSEQNLMYMGGLKSRIQSLLKHIYDGRCGLWLKCDIDFCNKLATNFNKYYAMYNGNIMQVGALNVKNSQNIVNINGRILESTTISERWE